MTAVETQQINNSDWHAIHQRSVPGAGRTLGQRRRRWPTVRPAPGRPTSPSPTTGNVSIQYSSFPPLRISNIPPERGARGSGQLTATSQEMRIISLFGQICPVLDLCQELHHRRIPYSLLIRFIISHLTKRDENVFLERLWP